MAGRDQWDPENNPLHRAVLKYLQNRWPILPIWWMEGERCACGKPHCNSPGKHPIAKLVPHGIKDATLDLSTAINWWTQYPKASIGIALGKVSGLVVVDVDGPSARELLEILLTKYEFVLDPKWTVETGRADGRRHLFYSYPPNVSVPTRKIKGLEVRSDGTYVVAPPSIHQTGKTYRWQNIPPGSYPDELPQCFIDFAKLGEKVFDAKTIRTTLRVPSGRPSRLASALGTIHSPPIWSAAEEARVRSALTAIPADDRDNWLRNGMALHWTGWATARTLWDEWSKKSPKYDPVEQDRAWENFGRPGYAGPVATLGTLFHLAKEHGWKEPPPDEIAEINARYFLIRNVGGKCLVGEMVPNPVGSGEMLSLQSIDALKTWYANRTIVVRDRNGNEKRKPLGPAWLEHSQRRQYEGVDLVPKAPKELPNGYLNLWRGYGIEPKQGKWPLMLQHICYVLADGDRNAAVYILRWIAWAVQHPGELAEVALVLRGGKGAGKGVFVNALATCFGEHALHIFHQSHLTGKFNGHLRSCLLLVADEAFWAGDKKGESVLKGLITEKTMVIEQKGIDPVQWHNRLKVIMVANAEWVVPASDDERRFAVFDVSNRYAQSAASDQVRTAYFAALHREIENGGVAAMLYDLINWDLGNWHPRQVYETEGLRKQKEQSLSPIEQWFDEVLQEGRLPGYGGHGKRDCATTRDLINDAHVRVPRLRDYFSDKLMGDFLRRQGCISDRSSHSRGWRFPPLAQMRAQWARKFGRQAWDNHDLLDWQ
jgi:hypothetical protein